jgi:hypothetical protein
MADTGLYLYAIIDHAQPREFGECGLDGGRVFTVPGQSVAAVVSEVPNRKVRPERRKLAAHFEVLKRLLEQHTLLPVAFGIIAEDLAEVERIVRLNEDSFVEQLQRLRGKIEMGLRLVWDVPNVIDLFVQTEPTLQRLRDQLFGGGQTPSQESLIELGRVFDQLRSRRREQLVNQVQEALAPWIAELKELALRNDHDAYNLALLIPASQRDEYEAAVARYAEALPEHFRIELNGPWPPSNFVELNLTLS